MICGLQYKLKYTGCTFVFMPRTEIKCLKMKQKIDSYNLVLYFKVKCMKGLKDISELLKIYEGDLYKIRDVFTAM